MFASLCRVCLSTKRLEIIANTQLQTIFEKLTSNQLIGDGRPESVCYECHQLLQKCCKFVNQSVRSERFLSQFFCSNTSNVELTKKLTIQNYIPHTLAVAKTILLSIPGTDESSNLFVKYEPEERKWEGKIDTENPVKISNIKTTNENDSMEAKPIDTSNYEGSDSYIAAPSTTQKPADVPTKICDDKISNLYDSMAADPLEQESTFDADRDDSSITDPDPTTPQKKGIIKRERHKKTIEIDLKDMTKTLIMSLEPPKSSKKNTYNCSECPKVFKQKAYLKRHIRTHTGEKPYACVICSQTFTDSVLLKQHIRNHNGEVPYTCHVCSKEFNQKPHLAEHIRTHTGEKPYECVICSYTFSHKSSLKRHMRIHSGDKPYICHKCPKQFIQTSNLKKHILSCKGDKTHLCVKCLQ